ncbi:MAG: thioredoxin family protein [Cyclobacteriaceae bacterium]
MTKCIDPAMFKRTFSYSEYQDLIAELVDKGLTSGPEQSEKFTHFTRLNFQRLKRVFRTLNLSEEIIETSKNVQSEMLWVVIVESWCGDVPQNLPFMEAISQISDKINLRIMLRDENPMIMDQFLTNGTRSIPKLICFDPKTYEVAGTWGPRPVGATELVKDLLKDPEVTADMRKEAVQRWYLQNRGEQLLSELSALLVEWDSKLMDQKLTEVD